MPLEDQPIDELVLHLFIAQAKGVPEEQHLEFDLETDRGAAAFSALGLVDAFRQADQRLPVDEFVYL